MFEAAARCRAAGKLVVFGGPLPSSSPEVCRPRCDVLFLNEAEETWPAFLADLARGEFQPSYACGEKPDVTLIPAPRFDLVDVRDYALIPVQYSRGCPYLCEFCDIIVMFGRRPRTKTPAQILAELDALEATGYRGMVFFADDNFIGNKPEVKKLLPELLAWNEAHGTPFVFSTEASINLAADPELLRGMVRCNFLKVFLGLETPSLESLRETLKVQNTKGSMVEAVEEIQRAGLLPAGGFILGFDNDRDDIFDRQIEFIEQAAIPDAMVNLLVALPGTPLFERLDREGRLLHPEPGNAVAVDEWGTTNVVTTLPRRRLLAGFGKVLRTLYTPERYFARCQDALDRLPDPGPLGATLARFLRQSRHRLGVVKNGRSRDRRRRFDRRRYLRDLWQGLSETPPAYRRASLTFLWRNLWHRPVYFAQALAYAATGLHYHRFTFEQVLPAIARQIERLPPEASEEPLEAAGNGAPLLAAAGSRR
jgi:radical SAM superfamily enzyme YgiQ (UPF0313 family)